MLMIHAEHLVNVQWVNIEGTLRCEPLALNCPLFWNICVQLFSTLRTHSDSVWTDNFCENTGRQSAIAKLNTNASVGDDLSRSFGNERGVDGWQGILWNIARRFRYSCFQPERTLSTRLFCKTFSLSCLQKISNPNGSPASLNFSLIGSVTLTTPPCMSTNHIIVNFFPLHFHLLHNFDFVLAFFHSFLFRCKCHINSIQQTTIAV